MGQCVSSCGSQRQVDSVPQTPDSEILPSLVAKSSPAAALATLSRKYNHPDRVYPCGDTGPEVSPLLIKTHILPSSDSDMNDTLRRFNSPKLNKNKIFSKTVTFSEVDGSNRKVRKPLISFNRAQIRTPSAKKHSLKKATNLHQSSYLLSSKLITNDNNVLQVQQLNKNLENEKKSLNLNISNGFESQDTTKTESNTMGNSPSSGERTKTASSPKPYINTEIDNNIQLDNNNVTITKELENSEFDQNGNCKESLKNLHSIREETKRLRESFFSPEPPKNLSSALVNIMNRPNRFGYNRPAVNAQIKGSTSNIPKLYSVPNSQNQPNDLKQNNLGPESSPKEKPKFSGQSNIQNKKPGNTTVSKFRINPALARLTPPVTTTQPASKLNPTEQRNEWRQASIVYTESHTVERPRGGTPTSQRRVSPFASHTALRAAKNETGPAKTDKSAVPATSNYQSGTRYNSNYSSGRYGLKKPEETKPFYTIGLYRNNPPAQTTKPNFAVHNSGFRDVSTGVVKEKMLQYQSKIGTVPKKTAPSSAPTASITKPIPPLIRSTTWTKEEEPQLDDPSVKLVEKKPDVPKSTAEPKQEFLRPVKAPLPYERDHSSDSFSGSSRPLSTSSREDQDCDRAHTTTETESSEETEIHDPRFPLRHDTSGASSLAASGHTDNVISDSEFLIDDEISDQPELTLTFKDSSVILSPSSSGESLVSCDIMLDLKERNFGELTSDSAISDVSSHKPSSVEHVDWSPSVTSAASLNHNSINIPTSNCKIPDDGGGSKMHTKTFSSQIPMLTPLSSKPNKSSFRANRIQQSQNTSQLVKTNRTNNSNSVQPESRSLQKSNSNSFKSVSSTNSSTLPRNKAASTEKRCNFMKQNQNRPSVLQSNTTTNPVPSSVRLKQDHHSIISMGLGSKELHDTDKTTTTTTAPYSQISEAGDSQVTYHVCLEDLERDLAEVKSHLLDLHSILEANEIRDKEKDELILELKAEIAILKQNEKTENIRIIAENQKVRRDIKYHENENYKMANAAVQTENNNIINKAVMYPEENDKMGQLVSFRIGRYSASGNKS